jgi:hypothetical protein
MRPVIVNAGGGTNFVGLMVRAVRLGLRGNREGCSDERPTRHIHRAGDPWGARGV